MTAVETEPAWPTAEEIPRGRAPRRVRKALAKVLSIADIGVDTVANFVPAASAVSEGKDLVKEALELGPVKRRLERFRRRLSF